MTTTSQQIPAGQHTSRILGICGSLRAESYNRKLLEAAHELAPSTVELELWDGLKHLPPFDQDHEADPDPAVLELRAAIAQADAVLIATPQYNASLPGQLKNALDWASRPNGAGVLRGKPVAVIGASPSPSGASRAQAEARTVLAAAGAHVLDSELAVARAPEQFDGAGKLGSVRDRHGLTALIEELARATEATEPDALAPEPVDHQPEPSRSQP
jgi:chromate reductase, NAD(P)H dehydrogenase (quinone)